jgi:peptide chain release factor 1
MLIEQLEGIKERFEEVSQQITMPEVVSDINKFKKISKEYRDLEKIVLEYNHLNLSLPI